VTLSEAQPSAANQRRVALATFVGTTIEYYDFFVFGSASALVFATLFFAEAPDPIPTLLAMATFGVSFVMRPVGGFIAGHLGDRYGRKPLLVWTLTLMAGSAIAIGLLPTYAAIGVGAPLLLIALRLVQGLAVGGEWGGAATMAIENAPAARRGLWGSMPQLGGLLGLVLANGATLIASASLGPDAFLSWGWRLPFLINILFLAVGLWIRTRVVDEVGEKFRASPELRPKNPIREVLSQRLGVTLKLIGAQAGIDITFYLLVVLGLTYLTQYAGVDRSTALVAVLVGAGVDAALQPVYGRLSDRVGRKPLMIGGAVVSAVLIVPYFALAGSGSPVLIVLGTVLLLAFGHAPAFAVLTSFVAEQYEPRYRYTGTSIAVQMGNLIWSAGTPLLGVYLLSVSGGSTWPLVALLVGGCVISIACILALKETAHLPSAQTAADQPIFVGKS
jgi:MFS transporter, MHS family, shikimate and dehydroshikimate transport protein